MKKLRWLLIASIFFFLPLQFSCGKLSLTAATATTEIRLSSSETPATCPDGMRCLSATKLGGKLASMVLNIGSDDSYPLPIFGSPYPVTVDGGTDGIEIDFATGTTIPGNLFCCDGPPYPLEESAKITSADLLFQYLDYTFEFQSLGSQTIRIYLVDVPLDGKRRGDKMLLVDGRFVFCDGNGCNHLTRPTTAVFMADEATRFNFVSQSNKNVIAVVTPISSGPTLSENTLFAGEWAFEVKVPASNAAIFSSETYDLGITTTWQMVEQFKPNGLAWTSTWPAELTASLAD